MSAELSEGKKLKRQIKVYGVESPVIITLSHEGISFRVKSAKLDISMTWPDAVNACYTPENVPSYLEGQPLAFLKEQAKGITKRAVKRADKKDRSLGASQS